MSAEGTAYRIVHRWESLIDPSAVTDLRYSIIAALNDCRDSALEEAAKLHDSIEPDCDRSPHGCKCEALGAIIRYRDLIRTLKTRGT